MITYRICVFRHHVRDQFRRCKEMMLRGMEPYADLLMLAVGDDIFRIGADLFPVRNAAASPIIVDIEEDIQGKGFFLLEDVGIEFLVFGGKFPIDLRGAIARRIFPHIDFLASRSFHDMLEGAVSFADDGSGELYAESLFHTLQLNG